jgi:uncharacterized protein
MAVTSETAAVDLAPARPDERISGLDAVRGFALLGILLLNICAFGLPAAAYVNPAPAGGASGANLLVWAVITVLADGKMRAIFSLTFGAGVYLLVDRLSRKGLAADAADIHYRRMLWLMLFGMMHAYLIWSGDILFFYATLGLILYPLRKFSARSLLVLAGIMMLGLTVGPIAYEHHLQDEHREYVQILANQSAGKKLTTEQQDTKKDWEDVVKNFTPSAEDLQTETDAHLGGYFDLLQFRAKEVFQLHSSPMYMPFPWFDMLGMMLIGIAMMKTGVLAGTRSAKFYVRMALVSFVIGVPANCWSVWLTIRDKFTLDALILSNTTYELGRFTAFGYIAVLLLIIKSGLLRGVTRTLASAGQMAFSNYILTSLICTTIFEGYGAGLFGKLQRFDLYAVVMLVWLVILAVSPIWLRHFRFGPLEWVWRSLTYWKRQPFRLKVPAGRSGVDSATV